MQEMIREVTRFFLALFFIHLQSADHSEALNWLTMKRNSGCNDPNLIQKQIMFCRRHPQFMDSLYDGANKAVEECQFVFRTQKWNCSIPIKQRGTRSSNNNTKKKRMKKRSPIVPAGTRESSFLHAISSAGVAFSITRACSSGTSAECGCDRSMGNRGVGSDHVDNFKWSGCSDNVDYGISLSRSFVDAKDHRLSRKNRNKTIALVNLHNNEAGRRIIAHNMRIDCKCHGVSGSCEVKSCWRTMPTMRQIGQQIRAKYEHAMLVDEKRTDSRRILVAKNPYGKSDENKALTSDVDLVFLRKSPDFCEENLKRGSLGTKGRSCSQNPKSPNSCATLCCSRGFTTTRIMKRERCKCKFEWCCNVRCEECLKLVEVSSCN